MANFPRPVPSRLEEDTQEALENPDIRIVKEDPDLDPEAPEGPTPDPEEPQTDEAVSGRVETGPVFLKRDVDIRRHRSLFDPNEFGGKTVDVIGCGAVGSRLAMELAKLGISGLRLWDFDEVEPHNLPNQAFGRQHVGRNKSEALAEMIDENTAVEAKHFDLAVTPDLLKSQLKLGPVVIFAVDSMAARKEIYEAGVKMNHGVELLIDTRMASDYFQIYQIKPTTLGECELYEETLYSDEEATEDVSACGTALSVGATASALSSFATWTLMRWHQIQTGNEMEKETGLPNELLMGLVPASMHSQDWSEFL